MQRTAQHSLAKDKLAPVIALAEDIAERFEDAYVRRAFWNALRQRATAGIYAELSPAEAQRRDEIVTAERARQKGPPPSITCPQCGRTSFNPADVRNRYCGACRQHHDEMGIT